MRKRSSKTPTDINQLAKSIVGRSTSEDETVSTEEREKNPAAVALGKLGGKKGGLARAAKLSPKRRKQIARKAALARWKRQA
jgi:hypothetical protein